MPNERPVDFGKIHLASLLKRVDDSTEQLLIIGVLELLRGEIEGISTISTAVANGAVFIAANHRLKTDEAIEPSELKRQLLEKFTAVRTRFEEEAS